MNSWKEKVKIEFERAKSARTRGNEAQARVCARRAAGIAIREYYTRQGTPVRTPGAYNLLLRLRGEKHLAPDLIQAAAYLSLHVNKEFNLPEHVDLLVEARKLCDGLLSNE